MQHNLQHKSMRFSRRYLLILPLLVSLIMSACQPVRPASVAASAPQTATSDVTFSVDETSIKGPSEIGNGLVKMTLKNSGQAYHALFVSRLAGDTTLQEAMKSLPGVDESKSTLIGGAFLLSGASNEVLLDLAPGAYYLVDIVAETPMSHEFVVSKDATANATVPTESVSLTEQEFAYVMPEKVAAGANWWQIKNTGKQPHDLSLYKLENGQTLESLIKTVTTEAAQKGPRSLLPMTHWVTGSGQTNWLHLDLAAGDYVILCLTPDFSTMPPGEAHYMKGMVGSFTVGE